MVDEVKNKLPLLSQNRLDVAEWAEFLLKQNTARIGNLEIRLSCLDHFVPDLLNGFPPQTITDLIKLVYSMELRKPNDPEIDLNLIKIEARQRLKASGWTNDRIEEVLEPGDEDPIIDTLNSYLPGSEPQGKPLF